MPAFKVRIDLANDAFQNPYELPKVLRRLADHLVFGGIESDKGKVLDANGNTVGEWSVTDD